MTIDRKQEPKYTVNPAGKIVNRVTQAPIPDNEPIIIFRAQDKNALLAMSFYMKLCGVESHKKAIKARIHDFVNYSHNNPEKMKEPDTKV